MHPSRLARSPTALRAGPALCAVLLVLGGCGTARVYRTRLGIAGGRARSLAASNIPSPLTAAVLDRQGIGTGLGVVRPGLAADALESQGASAADPDGYCALADLRTKQARQAEAVSPREAPGLYLDAVEAASHHLAGLPPSDRSGPIPGPREQEGWRAYNEAVAGFFRSSAGNRMRLDATWRDKLAARGIRVETLHATSAWDPDQFGHFYFAEDYRVVGIRDAKKSPGLGVPMIAERRNPADATGEEARGEEKFYPRKLKAFPATAVLRVGPRDDEGHRSVAVELIDPMRNARVAFDGGDRPLANDLTTPLAFYFTSLPLPKLTQVGLLRPGVLDKETGLFLLHPYERGKIPVVLIHGLWSSPDTWHQALNELRGDPTLRDRYQFWVYFYPTGDPFLYSAAKLRASLAEFRQTLDPDGTDSGFDRMVLVGHSMGGLLARLMVVDSGTTFWDAVANRPFADLRAGPEQRELVERVYFFRANPSIRRVLYIATPHRGSLLSGELVGRFGNALIRLPSAFEELQKSLRDQNAPDFFKKGPTLDLVTSITQLSDRSEIIAALGQRPFAPGVTSHSIIAKATPGPLVNSSDMIVTYESAHLPEAVTERVVEDNHSCLGNPKTIEEVRTILHLHLAEIGPPGADNRPIGPDLPPPTRADEP